MSLPSDLLARDQEIHVTRQHPVNYFYHLVATQDVLVLLDERFPNYHVSTGARLKIFSYKKIVPQLSNCMGSSTLGCLVHVLWLEASKWWFREPDKQCLDT